MAQINPHPALKRTVPQSPMVDGWMGDDWFHNGAFRISAFEYVVGLSTKKGEGDAGFALGASDDYTRYLEAGSAADFAKMLGITHYAGVRKFLENPAYTDFWSLQAVDKWLAAHPLTVPTLLEVGQWDQEDSYGAAAVYRALEPKDRNNDMVFLHIGPWRHSGANHYGYDLGALEFTGDTARELAREIREAVFRSLPQGRAGSEDAAGADLRHRHQPVADLAALAHGQRPTYLPGGRMARPTFDKPKASGREEYVSDPAKPVPFIPRPVNMGDPDQWKPWLIRDQRFVSGRPDVASWQTAPLDKPVHIMGGAGGAVVCVDHRHGQRLGGEAHRRVSQWTCPKPPHRARGPAWMATSWRSASRSSAAVT
jgi:predicted acyl esterase